jgi:hypothetical protein
MYFSGYLNIALPTGPPTQSLSHHCLYYVLFVTIKHSYLVKVSKSNQAYMVSVIVKEAIT